MAAQRFELKQIKLSLEQETYSANSVQKVHGSILTRRDVSEVALPRDVDDRLGDDFRISYEKESIAEVLRAI
jgi:hypothetical protein